MNQSAQIRNEPAQPDSSPAPAPPVSDLGNVALIASLMAAAGEAIACTNELDHLLERYGGLVGLMRAVLQQQGDNIVAVPPGLFTLLQCAHELTGRYLFGELTQGPALTSPGDSVRYLQHLLGYRKREVFQCLFLDTRHRVLHSEALFLGSIDGAVVYPRIVAERALRQNAAAVIVAHNHPSGVSEPSLADQAITRRLKDALSLFEIRLLDHFIIGQGEPVSMASRGML